MSLPKGPDLSFPHLSEHERYAFSPPEKAPHPSVVAWGGNLSPGMLLSAYEQGLFPWYSEDEPVIWHSPDPRYLLFPEDFHVSTSMKKIIKQGKYTISFDRDFKGVLKGCSQIKRPNQGGTWITGDMIEAYMEMHLLGWAHSAEAWQDDELVGGCYGLRLGNIFFGESMFSRKSNASKAAFIILASHLFSDEVKFIDCQTYTRHMESFGAKAMPRKDYIKLLRETLAFSVPRALSDKRDRRGSWTALRQLI